ncbi:MAG: apolipoprotein N-acyltransferase, partial [Desulfomonilaceae bacterium]
AVFAYGIIKLERFPNKVDDNGLFVTAGILQGDVAQDIKWDPTSRTQTFVRYEHLAEDALKHGANLMIWPETSVPVIIGGPDTTWKFATNISKTLNVSMLIGAPFETRVNNKAIFFNSAFLVEDGRLIQRYDKIHLVPFGEYMPLSWILPLGPGIAARDEDYSAGSNLTLMKPKGFPPFSVLICYEAIFPDLARTAVKSGAKVLVNITNDGWFGNSAAPYQHLAMTGFRAVENRVWLFRAANTGISAVYDPAGRLVASLPVMKRGTLVYKIPKLPEAGSFYTRHGDIFAWLIIGLLVTMIFTKFPVLLTLFRRRA